jgi:hypothetical protein
MYSDEILAFETWEPTERFCCLEAKKQSSHETIYLRVLETNPKAGRVLQKDIPTSSPPTAA